MSKDENKAWARLDNAAKSFPPTVTKSDTRVFRFSCELFEEVKKQPLQNALDTVIKEFPHFLCVLRQGMFWYYLEQCDLKPNVSEESERPCAQLYKAGYKTLLFRVTYYKKRINLEMFHSLTDGTGGMQFFRSLVLKYLSEVHSDELGGKAPFLGSFSSVSDKEKDSFFDYYQKEKSEKKEKAKKAYVFHGAKREDDSVTAIEGRVSVSEALKIAHSYGVTLTAFITAVFVYSVGREMTVRNINMPVVIGIPVNLRKYFTSETARNFFGLINISYTFESKDDSFKKIVASIDASMKREITKERLSSVMNNYSKLEHNTVVRIVPLPIKDFVIRMVRRSNDMFSTSVVSNLGAISMPEEVKPFIKAFGVITSTLSTQLCLCSYGDVLSLGFTTAFVGTEQQKNFFRVLAEMGLRAEIFCSDFSESRGE